MESKIKTQMLDIDDLLVEGWRLYQANFKNILLVILCVYTPVNSIISFVPVDTIIQNFDLSDLLDHDDILIILEFFIGSIATIGIASIVEKSLQGTVFSLEDALRYSLSKWTAVIRTGFLAGLILIGLTLLLIIPGIIWSLYYIFWIYVVTLRNVDGKAALDYSKSLVQGQWWSVCVLFIVLGIIRSGVEWAVGFSLNVISDNQIISFIKNTITDIVGAYVTIVSVVFFLNNDYRLKPAPVEQSDVSIIEA